MVSSTLKIVVVSENREVPETVRNMAEVLIFFPKNRKVIKQENNRKEIIITRKEMKWFKPLRGGVIAKLSDVQGDVLVIVSKKITPEVLNLIINFSNLIIVSCAESHWLKWADVLIKSNSKSDKFWDSVEKIFFDKLNLAEK